MNTPHTTPHTTTRGEDGEHYRTLASGNVALAYPAQDGSAVVVAIYDGAAYRTRNEY